MDRRDNPVFPAEGSLFRLSQEFAGIGGDVGFFKNELELQANLPLFGMDDFVLQGSFNCGLMKRIDPGSKTVTIADKFFLGGPLNMRGFELRGVGREADGCSLGGSAYWVRWHCFHSTALMTFPSAGHRPTPLHPATI